MASKRWRKLAFGCIAGLLLALGAAYILSRVAGSRSADACISEQLGTMPNIFGAKFDITYTNCDTLIKDEAIRVYVSPVAVQGGSWFAKWKDQRDVIFAYDPAIDERPPLIEITGKNKILISVSNVSDVVVQRHQWRNIVVDYRIGRIIDP